MGYLSVSSVSGINGVLCAYTERGYGVYLMTMHSTSRLYVLKLALFSFIIVLTTQHTSIVKPKKIITCCLTNTFPWNSWICLYSG